MLDQDTATWLEWLLGPEPDCDCGRPDRDAGHNPGCSWVRYMRGRLWLERASLELVSVLVAALRTLRDGTELMENWVDQFPRFDVEKPHPFLEQLHKNHAVLAQADKLHEEQESEGGVRGQPTT